MERGDSEVPNLEDWKAEAVAIKQESRRSQEWERPAGRSRCHGKEKPAAPGTYEMFPVRVQL